MHQAFYTLHNYLDPGTGSMLVQLLAASLVGGIGILLKIFWAQIKALFKGEKKAPQKHLINEDKTEK